MAQISYTNKIALNENPEIADINKVTDDDMNEIKQVVNDNYNNTIVISDTQPTSEDNKIWIDTGEVQNLGSEVHIGNEIDPNVLTNIVISNNLFNPANTITGKYVDNTTGTISNSANRISSGFIVVKPNTNYIISNVTDLSTYGKGMAYYNANKEFISGANLTNLTNGKFTTPANCRYIYFSYDIASTQFGSIMLNEGTTALSYEPYNRSIIANNNIIYEENNYENYATTEQRIGTWIDGKPLYRKVVSMTVPTTSTNGTAVDGETTIGSNIDVSFVEFGYIILNQNKWTLPASLDEYYTTTFTNAGNTLKIRNALTVFSGKTAYISILYTKTTD